MPLSLVFTPDAFYFGVLPVLSQAASAFDISGAEMGRAAIMGQITTGFPLSPLTPSTFLLIGLAGVELADLTKARMLMMIYSLLYPVIGMINPRR